MTASPDLFLLIQSLSSNEKGYFKKWASRHTDARKNYEKLFDAFDALPADEEYDEEALKKKTKRYITNFADEKKNLHELLMRAMRSFHAEKSVDAQLSDLLADEEFYRAKRLNNLRAKTIEKAKALAWKHERYHQLLILIQREVGMQIEWNPAELKQLSEAAEKEEAQVLHLLQTQAHLRFFSNKLFIRLRMNTNPTDEQWKKEAEQMLHDPLVKAYQPGQGFGSDLHYYRIHAFYHRIQRNMAEHARYTQLVYQLYEDNKAQRENNISGYKIALFNYLNAAFTAGDLSRFPVLLEKAKALPATTLDEEGENWQNIVHLELIYLANTLQLEEAVAMQKEILRGIKLYGNKVNKARELTLYFNLGSAYFLLEDWDKLLDCMLLVQQDKSDVRKDLKQAAHLLSMLAHFELGNYALLDSLYRSLDRYYKQQPILSEPEMQLARELLRLCQLPNQKQLPDALKKWFNHLEETARTALQKTEAGIWLRARMAGAPLRSMAS